MKSPDATHGGDPDPSNIHGKLLPPERHVQLIVVGAGPAGLAAATESAALGVEVMLVEEHPIDRALMGMDIPLRFGGRMDGSAGARGAVIERLVDTRPAIQHAFEVGIDIQLGVSAWGLFPSEVSAAMPAPMLGLTDGTRSWMVGYDRVIVATGARDLGLAFPGWGALGVVGARGAEELIGTYRAFSGRRMVVLGTGPLALRVCRMAIKAGIHVPAAVEVDTGDLPADISAGFEQLGITVRQGFTVEAVVSQSAGVTGVRLIPLVAADPRQGDEIACDTICSAVGAVPSVELLAAAGCATVFDPNLGGHCPKIDAAMRTSNRAILAVGDCTGLGDTEIASPDAAIIQGRVAAQTVARDLGHDTGATASASQRTGRRDQIACWDRWLQASCAAGGDRLEICLCENVALRDLVGLRPPGYLQETYGAALYDRGFGALLAEPPVNQDQIKRLTRAGMGVCQGRRCRDQVALLLAASTGTGIADIPLASYRPPVRPLPLSVLAPERELPLISETWVSWFSIATQSLPSDADLTEDKPDD
ncbi:FAD-dependent oxidoreductase [Pikeienuella piscinae]|uniref:FAD-dependent oxidoreductase n=1 Tax=Pikeienuella piscinae TaxID=2748098 RepID=A0A7L5C304_9RHOB|nr:FAD/NAD(P)-binding oxidoreductase [Pikeienuella piscinae]QIE56644.1 FAD-dependent oxidoreductase [Pikeienuella piscinae]